MLPLLREWNASRVGGNLSLNLLDSDRWGVSALAARQSVGPQRSGFESEQA